MILFFMEIFDHATRLIVVLYLNNSWRYIYIYVAFDDVIQLSIKQLCNRLIALQFMIGHLEHLGIRE